MKAVSYVALALSVVALALGIYAFTGGFGTAGTAVIGTTSTTGTRVGAVTGITTTSDARALTLTIGDTAQTIAVLDTAGTKLADVVLKPMTSTSIAGTSVFRGWYVSEIRVASGVEARFTSEVAPAVGTLVATDQVSIATYTDKAIATYVRIVNVGDFDAKLRAAAQAAATSTLKVTIAVDTNYGELVSDSRTKVTGISASSLNDFVTWAITAVTGGGQCDPSNPGCKGGQQQQGS